MDAVKIRKEFLFDLRQVDKTTKTYIEGKNYIAFLDFARQLEGLRRTLEEEVNKYNVEMEEVWTRTMSAEFGEVMYERMDVCTTEPPNSNNYKYALLLTSEDKNLLKYFKHLATEYLKSLKQVYSSDPMRHYSSKKKTIVLRKKDKSLLTRVAEKVVKSVVNFLTLE